MDALAQVSTGTACAHAPGEIAVPQSETCQECGSDNRLRLCATCGHVGCCESQAGHARAHALREGHAVIVQVPLPGGFAWCYTDARYL